MSQSDNLTEAELRRRLAEAEAALAALRAGKADTLTGDAGPLLFQLKSAVEAQKQAEALLACQTKVLELIATGASLATTLTKLIEEVEALHPGLLGSVLLLDEDGVRLRHGAAPSLPEAYTRAIDGLAIGPNVGSCGTAAFRGEAVIVEDIATDPLWKDYRELALAHGLRACWSTPIFDEQRRVLETFAIYYRKPGRPAPEHLRWVEMATHLAAVAIQKLREEATLRESEARFRRLFENSLVGIYRTTPDGRILLANPTLVKMLRYPSFEALAQQNLEKDGFHPQYPRRLFKEAIERDGAVRGLESAWICADGTTIYVRESAQAVRGPDGRIEYYDGVVEDITEQRRLEESLRQAQKMEAIGQLAGGVAHDFNNILTVILLQTELITGRGGLPDAAREGVQQIRAAAERAANLTRQLLLFSRRQVLQARDLDLNDVVSNLAKMLQRILGEDVRLELRLHPAPLMTHADAGMLDQVLMNLAVNARDAMPEGGRLIIETSTREISAAEAAVLPDVPPGFYVGLRVSDTGCGIPPEILPRIFEPFFTTKEPGKGTGLGLATVFGIVKQHGGCIQVASEPGRGTTFEVYLPALAKTAAAASATASRPAPRGGTETLLLVEDDPEVRSLTRATLERHGYRVLEAPDGLATLGLWRQHRDAVALLLTDLVMPGGLSGRDLARRLRLDRPQLKVIYTSGYSAELAGREWHPGPGEAFLQKPCPVELLLETVRQCLDAPADVAPA